jgi:cytochrome c peroxidase
MSRYLWPSAALAAFLAVPCIARGEPGAAFATDKEGIVGTYRKIVPEEDFATVKARDEKDKPRAMARQRDLLEERYDLSDHPSATRMSGGRKMVQEGVRVRLPAGTTWDQLSQMPPEQIRARNLFPKGFLPLPHVKHETGGQVFPHFEIEQIDRAEHRSLQRFDVDFDLPDHLLPEFPPPIFLQSRPELGDVSKGQLLTIKNYFQMFNGILTPVQIEGLRLLLTPFPQEEFNQTDDRKVAEPQFGVACLDCHSNFHTNGAFHLSPDIRPEQRRFRLDTVSLRGLFNQQIHGSKRSLRSVEDFSEFEQRTAYFNGDHVAADKKGTHQPNRTNQVSLMAQMQNMIDFPPAPKLDPFGKLDPAKATQQELMGEQVFFGKGRCAQCHAPPSFMDQQMHDLKIERFYTPSVINGQENGADGPIKTFTLRGIKDSPPYLHDGRLLTLEDTVEFFNLVLQLKLNAQEKDALVAYMKQL